MKNSINNNMNSISNSIVDGTTSTLTVMKENNLCLASQPTGKVSVDTILEYGRREMKRTGKNWFIFDMPVSLINIDNDYQRRVSDETVRKILKNYDPNRVDVKLVNFRFDNRRRDGGRFFILDGQHTLTVERELGHETLTCKVFIGLNKKEEAKLFATQNEFRRGITSYAKFRAEVVAGMVPAVTQAFSPQGPSPAFASSTVSSKSTVLRAWISPSRPLSNLAGTRSTMG